MLTFPIIAALACWGLAALFFFLAYREFRAAEFAAFIHESLESFGMIAWGRFLGGIGLGFTLGGIIFAVVAYYQR